MKVKVTSRTVTTEGAHKAGSTIEVDEMTGQSLIHQKNAEPVESPAKKTKADTAAKE
jgi:hypothetical protein